MILKSVETIPVCSLSLEKEKNMSRSKSNRRQPSTLFDEHCLSARKESLRQPLQCKKNVIDANRSMQKSSKNRKDPCPVNINKLSISPKKKTSKKHGFSDTVKIDVLSKKSEKESLKSPKRALRSSSRHNVTLHSKEEVLAINKSLSACNSQRKQNILGKRASQASQTLPLESPNTTERPSFYRSKSTSQYDWKSDRQSDMCSKIAISPVLQELHENVRSVRHSMKLRSQEISEKNSGNVERPSVPEKEHVKSPTVTPKRQKINEQRTKVVRRLSKRLSSAMLKKNSLTVKRTKCVRKPSQKSQKLARPKSFSGSIPIDDLALSPCKIRKTKSDGFKFPGRNTLKRKRFIINAMKNADAEYEDDIYEAKKFDNFKKLFPDTSDSELSYAMTTPKLGFHLTPLIRNKTPAYKDCFSPTEYALSRKVAEECFFKNKKRKSNSKEETAGVPEKRKLEFNKILEDVCKVQEVVEKLMEEKSDNEDSYFTEGDI